MKQRIPFPLGCLFVVLDALQTPFLSMTRPTKQLHFSTNLVDPCLWLFVTNVRALQKEKKVKEEENNDVMRFSIVKKFENREQKDNYLFVATELLTFRRAIPGSLSTLRIDKTHGKSGN